MKTGQTHLFKNGTPGAKWYTGFLKRHPNLSIRVAQNFAACRAKKEIFKISDKVFSIYIFSVGRMKIFHKRIVTRVAILTNKAVF